MKITPEIIKHFEYVEGKVNFMYLDGVGIVTIGVGCAITLIEALALPFMRETLLNATTVEIKLEYVKLKMLPAGRPANFYSAYASLYLGDAIIEQMFQIRLFSFVTKLQSIFTDFETYPENIKLVLLDMAYNLGASGLVTKFPNFIKAIKEFDYARAAKESFREDVAKSRNLWASDLLNGAAQSALVK